jgi:molybdopterin converting factor small subunit
MAVTVSLPAVLARHAGGVRTHVASGSTLGDAIGSITRDYPELGVKLAHATNPSNAFVAIYVNDEDSRFLGGLTTPIRDGDEISVVSAIAGG